MLCGGWEVLPKTVLVMLYKEKAFQVAQQDKCCAEYLEKSCQAEQTEMMYL